MSLMLFNYSCTKIYLAQNDVDEVVFDPTKFVSKFIGMDGGDFDHVIAAARGIQRSYMNVAADLNNDSN